MTIKVVTFDLDDTLWDTPPILIEAEKDMVDWLNGHVSAFQHTYSTRGAEFRDEIVKNRPQIKCDLNKTRVAVLERALRECSVDEIRAYELATRALSIFHGRRNRFKLNTGAEELLRTLSKQYFLASITNGTSEVNRSILGSYFDISLRAADAGVRKPDPAMFQMVLRHVGARPHEGVHIGDHPVDDIQAAASIGMHTIQVVYKKEKKTDVASRVVYDLKSVESAIEALDTT